MATEANVTINGQAIEITEDTPEQFRVWYVQDGTPMLGYSLQVGSSWHALTQPKAMSPQDVLDMAARVTRRNGQPFRFDTVQYSGWPARHVVAGAKEFTLAERMFRHADEIRAAQRAGQPLPAKQVIQRRQGDAAAVVDIDPMARVRGQAVQHAAAAAQPAPQAQPTRQRRTRTAQQLLG